MTEFRRQHGRDCKIQRVQTSRWNDVYARLEPEKKYLVRHVRPIFERGEKTHSLVLVVKTGPKMTHGLCLVLFRA